MGRDAFDVGMGEALDHDIEPRRAVVAQPHLDP